MLQELDIEGYAVVDRLRVEFHSGLNLLTGETGSGKSIVVDSLALLFGARASADVVRAGASKARVCGRFECPPDVAAQLPSEDGDGDSQDDELILERHVLASGKSRAYINGSPATLAQLRQLAAHIGDIHGQHEQQTLLSAAAQLRMVDVYAGLGDQASAVRAAHQKWTQCTQALSQVKGDEQERLHRLDLLRYQSEELFRAALVAGEDEVLGQEQKLLANAEDLRTSAFAAFDSLYDSSESASTRIKSASADLEQIAHIDRSLAELAQRLEEARATVDDVAFELQAYLGRIEADPARLEEVEERLAALDRLKRKYGPSLPEVLAFQHRVDEELALLDSSDQQIEALERVVEEAAADYARRAQELSGARRKGAKALAAQTRAELRDLALPKAEFAVAIDTIDTWTETGTDRAGILFSANPGQPARPLGQVASGGELSRVALALKTVLQAATEHGEHRRTYVFDEIDAGVGGGVAEAIGRRLGQLSRQSQILCVTHLPQIACFADAHFHVSKSDDSSQTTATVRHLSASERVGEVARMLSGAEVSEAALANAKELLRAYAPAPS
ncbi:MAG: DNA repair protein RecN [Bryobacterales bacterium]|nr:DNA repair protein RecN [Bryobacterales bacterium]